jgi:hypothetical protein
MMLTLAPRLRPALWFAGLLLALLFVERLVTTLPEFSLQPALPAAVTFDLLLGIPLLYYWLIVRRYQLPVTTVVAAFGAALAIGYYLIPKPQQQHLHWASQSLGLLKVGVVVVSIINLRRLVRAYQAARQHSADYLLNLSAAFQTVFGRSLGPLVSEISMFRYALLSWRAAPEVGAAETAYFSHRESGFTPLIITLAGLSVVETGAVHLLASRWNATAALVLLILDLYTLVFLLAHLRAVALRPVVVTAEHLVVRVGFVWRAVVPLQSIAAVEALRDEPTADKQTLNVAKPLLTSPNVLITLAEPTTVTGMYGIQRRVNRVALYVDNHTTLRQQLLAAAPAA